LLDPEAQIICLGLLTKNERFLLSSQPGAKSFSVSVGVSLDRDPVIKLLAKPTQASQKKLAYKPKIV